LSENYSPGGDEILFDTLTAVFETISKTMNAAAGGYGSTNEEYDLSKGLSSVAPQMANALAGVLNVSFEMKGSQRASTMPFKSDNTHDNYNLANVQNLTARPCTRTKRK
jgi:hypothetical protein